jgi:hypothetical protein
VTDPAPLSIVELRASNVKRLRAVTIRPDQHGNLVVLGGRNGQGKTSVLDAITMALGGKDACCPEPLRRGADHGEVVVDLGELVVRRTFTAGGGGTLVVSNKEGARFQSPQTMLDALVGKLTFDPLAFSRETGKRKAEILRDLLGLDFAGLDQQRAAIYADRMAVNRRASTMRTRAEGLPHYPDAPAEAPSVAGLVQDLERIRTSNREVEQTRAALLQARQGLELARDVVAKLQEQLTEAEWRAAEATEKVVALEARVETMPEADPAPVLGAISNAEACAKQVEANWKRAEAFAEAALATSESERLTEAIDAIDEQKTAAIAAADIPVPGLGFDADGNVTLDRLPLEQASSAEQLRVSVAIGARMNPRLRVLLIRDASLLDHQSLRLLAETAHQAGMQCWLERVESDEMTTVLIEDGEAVAPRAQETTA